MPTDFLARSVHISSFRRFLFFAIGRVQYNYFLELVTLAAIRRGTVGSKIIRAFEIVRVKKLIFNAVL